MNTKTLLAASLLLIGPVLGQDSKPTTAPQKAGPAIVVKTADLMVGMGALANFDPMAELPDIEEGQHFVITVTTDGKATCTTAGGDVGFLAATVYPDALMQLFKAQIDANWEMIQDGAILGMTQVGLSAKDAAKVMKAVRAFPSQMATLRLNVKGDPRNGPKGVSFDLAADAAQGSFMERVVKAMRPHPQGAPALPFGADGMLKMSAAMDPAAVNELLKPLLELAAGIGAKNKKEREANLALYTKFLEHQDGAFSASGDPFGGGLLAISSVRDGKGCAALLGSPDYTRVMEGLSSMSPMVESEFKPKAGSHRDVNIAKTTITTDMDTPTMPDGEQITYFAVAADYMVQTQGTKIDETKKLIDAALDQKIKRAPMPAGKLFTMEIKFMDMMDKVSPIGNPFAGQEEIAPKLMKMDMSVSGSKTLGLSIRFD